MKAWMTKRALIGALGAVALLLGGTAQAALQDRDLDGDTVTDAFYDTDLDISGRGLPRSCEPDSASADGGRSSTPDPVQQLLDEAMGLFERARALTDAETRQAEQRVADLKAAAANASEARRKTMSAAQKLAEEGLREVSRRGGEISAVVGNLRAGFGR